MSDKNNISNCKCYPATTITALGDLVDLGVLTKKSQGQCTSPNGMKSPETREFVRVVDDLTKKGFVSLLREYREAQDEAFPRALTADIWHELVEHAVKRTPQRDHDRVSVQPGEWPSSVIGVDGAPVVQLYAGERSLFVEVPMDTVDYRYGSTKRDRSATAFERLVYRQVMGALGYRLYDCGEWADAEGNRAYGTGKVELSYDERVERAVGDLSRNEGLLPS